MMSVSDKTSGIHNMVSEQKFDFFHNPTWLEENECTEMFMTRSQH